MKFYSLKLYFKDRLVMVPLALTLVLQGCMWWLLLSVARPGMDQVFLHYNIIFGVDKVGPWWHLFFLPVTGAAVVVVNYLISLALYGTERFMARLFSVWVLFFHILLSIGVFLLAKLNA